MGKIQKRLLEVAGVFVVGMILFPPFDVNLAGDGEIVIERLQYEWLFTISNNAHVDQELLLFQLLGVAILTCVALFFCADEVRTK